ncbi:MAG TPA: hypothetical protein DD727_03235 [Clostridiales bacterium]|nr:hypothetical protein [Clostridiales bacterium]
MDEPGILLDMVDRTCVELAAWFQWLEQEGLLVPNHGNDPVNAGTYGFTRNLGGYGGPVTLKDLWIHMDSQETVGISPETYGEFFAPFYHQLAGYFGLVSYGCCEPVHPVWEDYVKKLPGLRKVSISPWCNEEFMGEALQGSGVIYHRKPSPNFLGVGTELDLEAYRQHISRTLKAARGCQLEFSIRNIYTLGGNVKKPRMAVETIRELLKDG